MSNEQQRDRHADENLAAFGKLVELPPAADPRAVRQWRQTAPSTRIIRMPRFARFAAAAAVVLSVGSFLHFGTGPARVEAATIIASLRTSVWQSLYFDLQNIETEGVGVDGQIEVLFDRPISMAAMLDEENNFEVLSAYGRLEIIANDDAEEDLIGMDLRVEGGYRADGGTWAFVDMRGLPTSAYEEPAAALVLGMLQGGVLLDLDGLLADDEADGAIDAVDDGEEGPDDGVRIKWDIDVDTSEADGEPDPADDGGVKITYDSSVGITTHGENDIAALLEPLLRGNASPEDLLALADQLEEAADVTVEDAGDGLFILRATQFETDDADMADATLQIGYVTGSGVQWLEVQNVGEVDGVLRVGLTDAPPTDHLGIRAQMLENGVRLLDLGAMFGGE